MGVSISLHVYPLATLLPAIERHVENSGGYREGALPVREWFSKVADEFGEVADGKFYVVWNEYYEDYNPASNFLSCVDDYYFPNHDDEDADNTGSGYWDTFWANDYKTVSEGANSGEILAELFEDEFGYEGTLAQNDY